MPTRKIRVKAPGKLMVAGEYAILEPNQHAVVTAIDRYIAAEIETSEERAVALPHLDLPYVAWKNNGDIPKFQKEDSRLQLLQKTIGITNRFLRERSVHQAYYKLTVLSELQDNKGRKYGLGSSAALAVATIASILEFHEIQLSKEKLFKLAVLAHLQFQGNGSGADIAAAVFGGCIYYSSFLPKWVLVQLKEGITITELLDIPWPNLSLLPLTVPKSVRMCVGWTQEIARTGPMVEKVQTLRTSNPEKYEYFLRKSGSAVNQIVRGFKENSPELVLSGIGENRHALIRLGKFTNTPIETAKLKKLCDLAVPFGSAKPSGAGGGDCGIAFVPGCEQKNLLHRAWEAEGIIPLLLNLSWKGAHIV